MRYTPLPCNEVTRGAIRADPAQISGLETVAKQQSSPNLRRRSVMSLMGNVFAAHDRGELGRGSEFRANSPCINVTEKSFLNQFHSHMHKGGLPQFQFPKTLFQRIPNLG